MSVAFSDGQMSVVRRPVGRDGWLYLGVDGAPGGAGGPGNGGLRLATTVCAEEGWALAARLTAEMTVKHRL
ncbi:hypothetical protein [Streptomyces sp. H34-S4]|uniref:hypothetical protein n=1 Tax=Streptomyces sp. H34-S4 TaxID=2996463 RepID=UPI00226F614A|nr:hypothetical protein [Streptomyces sp. H34-S4]MCY0936859.1 hypothetical protein [Streptomyces sp. H34-S4]